MEHILECPHCAGQFIIDDDDLPSNLEPEQSRSTGIRTIEATPGWQEERYMCDQVGKTPLEIDRSKPPVLGEQAQKLRQEQAEQRQQQIPEPEPFEMENEMAAVISRDLKIRNINTKNF